MRRSLVWFGVVPLIAFALISAGGRAIVLATGSEPFAWLYPLFPATTVEDSHALDRWFADHAALTWTHIVAGSLVLVLAPLQFVRWIRQRHVRLHRWSGRTLLIAAVPTALSGMMMQTISPYGGGAALSAIFTAGTLFLVALILAYRAIRRRDTAQHREWMIRLFAVALGIGTVRVVSLPLIAATGRRPLELMGMAFWLGFALPIIAGELWIRSTRRSPSSA